MFDSRKTVHHLLGKRVEVSRNTRTNAEAPRAAIVVILVAQPHPAPI